MIRCHFTFFYDDEDGHSVEKTWRDHRIPGVPVVGQSVRIFDSPDPLDRVWQVLAVCWVCDEKGFYGNTEPWHLEVSLH